MPRFKLKQSNRHLTSHAGLALVGHCFEAAQLTQLDTRFPTSAGIKTSDIVKSYTGLLSLGKSDFEALESFRHDRLFQEALGLRKVPSSVWLRQRLEQLAGVPVDQVGLREELTEHSVLLLQATAAPITAHQGFVCLDFDTFLMDNGGTQKAGGGTGQVDMRREINGLSAIAQQAFGHTPCAGAAFGLACISSDRFPHSGVWTRSGSCACPRRKWSIYCDWN